MAAEKQTFSSGWGHPNCPYWIDLIVQETAVNTAENYSDVFFDLRARSEKSWDLEFRGRLGYITVDGTRIQEAYTDLSAYDGDGGAYNRRICSITKRIYHDSDGKKTVLVCGFCDRDCDAVQRAFSCLFILCLYRYSSTFKAGNSDRDRCWSRRF